MKIDWLKAQRDYVSDPTMSYAKIAYKYGVSETVVKEWAARQEWTKKREAVIQKVSENLPEKIAETETAYRARKYHQGKMIADKAVEVLMDPRTRISGLTAKEMLDTGHKLQTEAMGIDPKDKPPGPNIFISLTDFVALMEQRRVQAPVIDGQEVTDPPGATG